MKVTPMASKLKMSQAPEPRRKWRPACFALWLFGHNLIKLKLKARLLIISRAYDRIADMPLDRIRDWSSKVNL